MFQDLLKNKIFRHKISVFFKKYQNKILDIIIFGSLVRGKEKPEDTDILLLFANKEDIELQYELRNELKSMNLNINTTIKSYHSLQSESFLAKEAFLEEGYSLIYNSFIAEGFGFENYILFKYELKGFTQSQRMQVQYSLYGRNKEGGIIKELSLIKFADCILLSPIQNAEKTKNFLLFWNIKFEEFPVLFPLRLKKIIEFRNL